jgi:hypothetical protein
VSPQEALLGYCPEFRHRIEGDSTLGEVPAVSDRLVKLAELRKKLSLQWQNSVERHAKYYNNNHKAMTFRKGDLVALSTKNLKLKVPNKKLGPKYIGPFRILETIGTQAYRLSLPSQYNRIHNVFPVSLLEPWHLRKGEVATNFLQMPDLEDEEEWEVEEIKGETAHEGETHYLVKWAGWPAEYNQWVPEPMVNAPRLVSRFRKRAETRAKPQSPLLRPPADTAG